MSMGEAHTSRRVVANGVPRVHVGIEGTLLAKVGVAAELLRVLPDELREVAPVAKVGHIRGVHAVLGELVELAVVPVAGSPADRHLGTDGLSAAARSPISKILAVAATVDGASQPVSEQVI